MAGDLRERARGQERLAIGVAVSALAADPNPSDAFVRGDYRRLKVGGYRTTCVIEVDVITIELANCLFIPRACSTLVELSSMR